VCKLIKMNAETRVEKSRIDDLIGQLEDTAAEKDAVIYNIMRRNAGWGILWYEKSRLPGGYNHEYNRDRPLDNEWRKGLIVYKYYPTLFECIEKELERLRT